MKKLLDLISEEVTKAFVANGYDENDAYEAVMSSCALILEQEEKDNKDILDKFFLLKYADTFGGGTFTETLIPSAENIRNEYRKMLEENVPFSLSELLVDGNDLQDIQDLPPNKRGECLNELLLQCAYSPTQFNTKEKQLKFIETYIRRQPWITK